MHQGFDDGRLELIFFFFLFFSSLACLASRASRGGFCQLPDAVRKRWTTMHGRTRHPSSPKRHEPWNIMIHTVHRPTCTPHSLLSGIATRLPAPQSLHHRHPFPAHVHQRRPLAHLGRSASWGAPARRPGSSSCLAGQAQVQHAEKLEKLLACAEESGGPSMGPVSWSQSWVAFLATARSSRKSYFQGFFFLFFE